MPSYSHNVFAILRRYWHLWKLKVQSILQGMLKSIHGQPAMGRQPGLEELSQEEKMLHLRWTRKGSSQMRHRNPSHTRIHPHGKKVKPEIVSVPTKDNKWKQKLILTFFCRSSGVFIEKAKTEKCLVSGNQKLKTFWPQTKTIWGFWVLVLFWVFANSLAFLCQKTAHFSSFFFLNENPKIVVEIGHFPQNFFNFFLKTFSAKRMFWMNNFIQLCKQIPWRDYHTFAFISSPQLTFIAHRTQGCDHGLVLTTLWPSFMTVDQLCWPTRGQKTLRWKWLELFLWNTNYLCGH